MFNACSLESCCCGGGRGVVVVVVGLLWWCVGICESAYVKCLPETSPAVYTHMHTTYIICLSIKPRTTDTTVAYILTNSRFSYLQVINSSRSPSPRCSSFSRVAARYRVGESQHRDLLYLGECTRRVVSCLSVCPSVDCQTHSNSNLQ